MEIKNFQKIYLLGIGGIGMSSIAQFFLQNGKNVAGYDREKTELTKNLEDLGAKIHYKSNISKIPVSFKCSEKTLVIYTPAINFDNKEFIYFKQNKFLVLKRSDVLSHISKNKFCIAVAGTHGKTTTSSILTHILFENNFSFSSFVGGISENYNSNYINNGKEMILVEADEFDRSFLKLSPDIACVTSIDFDHSDIYKNRTELLNSFKKFSNQLKKNGIIIKKYGLQIKGETYGFNPSSDYFISNFKNLKNFSTFDINHKTGCCKKIRFQMLGKHNAENVLAAFVICKKLDMSDSNIKTSIQSFKGVKRRFTYVLRTPKVLIDDYAHHPVEINEVKKTILNLYKNKKVTVIFQPHLFSRTRDLMDEFADVLSDFYEVILLDIYPAREKPIRGISSSIILDKIINKNKKLLSDDELYENIKRSKSDVFVMLGAGDIAEKVVTIKKLIKKNGL